MPGAGSPERGLRLRAEDADDLALISACLQDALVAVSDLAYDSEAGAFVFVANRFCWEGAVGEGSAPARFERTLCGVAFHGVEQVAYRGFQRTEEDRILSLLAIRCGTASGGTAIDLDFSAGAAIRLKAAAIRCHARDLGKPWPTAWRPDHPTDEP
jgi:hypothetical protein